MKSIKKAAIAFMLTIGLGSSAFAGTLFDATQASTMEIRHVALGYGEISPRTGRPATNYVNGYYRSNGTYVNGYWRS